MRTAIFLLTTALTIPSSRVPLEVDQLDTCIQNRFVDMRAMGMRRVLPRAYHGVLDFAPENPVETSVIQQLKAKDMEVVFYLVGRGVLGESTGPFLNPRRAGVQGPAFITPSHNFPAPDELLTESRTALKSVDRGADISPIRHGEWTIAMRPLRAHQGRCVECHVPQGATGLKIGDALGVAMYAYRERPTDR
jgi:hypothetical protein